jgi:hypothetical protein
MFRHFRRYENPVGCFPVNHFINCVLTGKRNRRQPMRGVAFLADGVITLDKYRVRLQEPMTVALYISWQIAGVDC